MASTPRKIREIFLKEFSASLAQDTAALFVGAGASIAAGYPSWKDLLRDIGSELGVDSNDIADLAALAQWHIMRSSGATKIRQVIQDEIGVEHPIPSSLEVIARLPLRHIWTTNYDTLIERAFSSVNRPLQTISAVADLVLKPKAGASRLYKMHGSVTRLDDIVISTDDSELFRSERGAFLPLLQAHLSSLSVLFVGLSFTDPNVRHVLSLIRESFTKAPPEHFAIVRPPHRKDFKTKAQYETRRIQHDLWADDLKRYGLKAIEIDDYDEVPTLLRELEVKVAQRRVWISGSWPVGTLGAANAEFIHQVAYGLGKALGDLGLTLVSGSGLLVGSASVSGFLSSLQTTGSWDLERRLIARPFPQPLAGKDPDRQQWQMLRSELGRLSGIAIFVGGQKIVDGKLVDADGVLAEFEVAANKGSFLIPLGATGGAARQLAERLLASSGKSDLRFPTKKQLKRLMEETSPDKLVKATIAIVREVAEG
jgi:hypothetical protein